MYLHSPFIFELSNHIFESINQQESSLISNFRQFLTSNTSIISLQDKDGSCFSTSVSTRYKKTSISSVYGKILRGLQEFMKAKNVLELGTSLGVSTLYFETNLSHIDTIDLNDIGKKIVSEFSETQNTIFSNITFRIGNFETKLPEYLEEKKTVDFVFIDGDHTYESTIKNTHTIIPFLSKNSCIVLDDIRWNEAMYAAWNELKSNSNFNYTIDFGRIGVLMKINNHAPKQHFILHL